MKNIKIIQSLEYEIPLEKQSLDFALLAFVLHEVADRVRFLTNMAIYLKPDGRLILLEWKKKKDVEGPPFKDRISLQQMLYLAEKAYLKVERRKNLNSQHYLAIFSIAAS
ncbi:MAG TPA: methyltransferase domain-containing protein [Syntrophaceae bacterium]|nr:methyltransferase domain-containing protein [Syntrophaceae bacterium]